MSSLKIYVAAPWSHRLDAAEAKKKFEDAGFEVTASWITSETDLSYDDATKPEFEQQFQDHAIRDVEDILHSDVFVILNLDKSEGKATELGIAYGLGIPTILVGPRTRNIFYFLPAVFRADTVEKAIEGITEAQKRNDSPVVELVN